MASTVHVDFQVSSSATNQDLNGLVL